MSRKNEFLEKFAKLCEQYDATLECTTDDDGIHIFFGIEEIFAGYLNGGYLESNASEALRLAKD